MYCLRVTLYVMGLFGLLHINVIQPIKNGKGMQAAFSAPDLLYHQMMPLVGGSWGYSSYAGLCARDWGDHAGLSFSNVGVRLSAYGVNWTECAGAHTER